MNAQGIKKSWSMNKSSLPGPKLKKLILKADPTFWSWVGLKIFWMFIILGFVTDFLSNGLDTSRLQTWSVDKMLTKTLVLVVDACGSRL
jgi:hypothetical protein